MMSTKASQELRWMVKSVSHSVRRNPAEPAPGCPLVLRRTAILIVLAQVLPLVPGCRRPSDTQPSDAQASDAQASDTELFNLAVDAVSAGKSDAIDMYKHPNIPETEFSKLAGLNRVRFLRLDKCRITDEHVGHLLSMSRLETLYLSDTKITDAGLEKLCRVKSLNHLTLDGTRVTDNGLSHLKALPNLEKLSLWRCNVTDRGCDSLAQLTTLKQLSLDGTPVSDNGIQKLYGLKDLEDIRLWGTLVTDNGVAALQNALPNLEVHR